MMRERLLIFACLTGLVFGVFMLCLLLKQFCNYS